MSDLERSFLFQVRAHNLQRGMQQEYRFHHSRKWRFDFAWPEQKIAVEIEGGVWTRGRHTRGKGFENDCEKLNTATVDGWRVLRIPELHVTSGRGILWLEQAMRKVLA